MSLLKTKELDANVVVEEFISFDISKKQEYISIFNTFKDERIIINCSFEDVSWIMYDQVTMINIYFNFDELVFKEEMNKRKLWFNYEYFIIGIKSFILMRFKYFSVSILRNGLNSIKTIIKDTHYFSPSQFDQLRIQYDKDISKAGMLEHILDFLSYFTDFESNEAYSDCLFEYHDEYLAYVERNSSNRSLPDFQSVFLFSDIISRFFSTCSIVEKEEYYPILLWWKITNIIPLRFTELLVTPKDCLSQKDNKYYITLRRSNMKGAKRRKRNHKIEESYRLTEVEINEELYEDIMEYSSLVQDYDNKKNFYELGVGENKERRFLFSYRSYYNYRYKKNLQINMNTDYFGPTNFYLLLNRFYKNIIRGRYNINILGYYNDMQDGIGVDCIEKIRPLDTRHLAIINMLMQDFNPIVIKELSGHDDVKSTFNYYNHLPRFVKCWIYSASKRKNVSDKERQEVQVLEKKNLFGNINPKYELIFKTGEKNNGIDCNTGLGKCFSALDKLNENCLRVNNICELCKWYHPNEIGRDKIQIKLDSLEESIDKEILLLREIAKKYGKLIEFDEKYRTSLNRLHCLMGQSIDICINHDIEFKISKDGKETSSSINEIDK